MASDRRLRSTNSPRTSGEQPLRSERDVRGARQLGNDIGGMPGVPRRPRPDGLPGSMRAASTRRRVQSTRRVTARTVDARNRRGSGARWRPYAPSAAVPMDVWGTDPGNDDRPLVSELTTEELAAEALSALRTDRPVPQSEPWLLDIGAATAIDHGQPTAKRRFRMPKAGPGDAPARPSPQRHASRHAPPRHAAAKRGPGRRIGWVVVTGAAVLVVGGWGWQMVASANDGSGTSPVTPVTSTGQVVPATGPVGPLGPPASAGSADPDAADLDAADPDAADPGAADPGAVDGEPTPTVPTPTVPTPTLPTPTPGTAPAGEPVQSDGVSSEDASPEDDPSAAGDSGSGSRSDEGSAEPSSANPSGTAVREAPRSTSPSTTSDTPGAPAVVSPLESGDPGFGWPTTAFGTPAP